MAPIIYGVPRGAGNRPRRLPDRSPPTRAVTAVDPDVPMVATPPSPTPARTG